jgi:type VI secretion system ImpA/VasJ family protein
VKGLTAGLQGIDALTTSYWKEMYPPLDRRRGRRRILAFLIEQLRDTFPPDPSPADVEPEDAAGLPAAIRCLDALTDRWEQLMGELPPPTRGLRKRLCALQTAAEAGAPSENDAPERDEADALSSPARCSAEPSSADSFSPQRPPPASSGPASVPAEPPSPAAVPSDAPPGGNEPAASDPPSEADLLRWAGRLLDEDPTDPRSYRLLRLLRWDPISRTPPHEKTRTSLPAPTPSRREALQRLFDAGNDALFLEQAEAAFQQPPFHFWLDLQHLLCKTLNRAGPSFLSAHDAVRTEILRLFQRLPALLDLQFSDDTPFARPETKRWITQQPALSPPGALSDSTASTDASATGAPETDAVGSALSAATDRLSRDGLAAALQHLQDASSDRSARTRFRVRLGMAVLCIEDGAPRLAYPLLQSLAAEGQRRNLDRWNPDLLADVWTHLFRCCLDLADRSGSRSNSDDERDTWLRAAEAARGRVCALSPDRALSLFSSRDDPSTLLPGTMQRTEMINRTASST